MCMCIYIYVYVLCLIYVHYYDLLVAYYLNYVIKLGWLLPNALSYTDIESSQIR